LRPTGSSVPATKGAIVTDWKRYPDETDVSFPGESAEYRAARDRLLAREAELRHAMEAVAAARRELPPGGLVPEDYVFEAPGPDGDAISVRMSELFEPGRETLLVYSFMFGPEREDACPMCTAWLDVLDPAAKLIAEGLDAELLARSGYPEIPPSPVNLVVVAESPLPRILAHAERRGWRNLRLLSTAGNAYNRDYHGRTAKGTAFFDVPQGEVWEMPMLNVFHRDGEEIRHFWGSELLYAPSEPGQDPRHLDAGNLVMNLLDLTPGGRG
jgi:predicted dithiol-disulfide oxidoreductase (DUF899 family)